MTAINESGQVYWTFEDLDLEGAAKQVEKEYDLLREQLKSISKNFPRTRKALISRCSVLLDVRENIYELLAKGLYA